MSLHATAVFHPDREEHAPDVERGIWYGAVPSADVGTVLRGGLWPTQQIGYPSETSRVPEHVYLIRSEVAMWEPDWTGIALPSTDTALIAVTLAGIKPTALCRFDRPRHPAEAATTSRASLQAHPDRIAVHGRLIPERLIAVPPAVRTRLADWEREVALLLEGPGWDLPLLPIAPATDLEPLSESLSDSPFGEIIAAYSRADALADGSLVDVSDASPFRWPTALTRAAWEDCVAWTEADTVRKLGLALQETLLAN
ncbi:DUF6573 family protein [Streptosporangium sp. NPDC048047]|uniref:DUF6573 family protein n=1 Tax=Streptosporangium sp. NPDC048047 TaxID=3155748 RepID=UPI0034150538